MKSLKCPKWGGVADIEGDYGWECLRTFCRACGHDFFIARPSAPLPLKLSRKERTAALAAALDTLPAEGGEGLKGVAIVSVLRESVGYRFPVSMDDVAEAVAATIRWMLSRPPGKRRLLVLVLTFPGLSVAKSQPLPMWTKAAGENIGGGSLWAGY